MERDGLRGGGCVAGFLKKKFFFTNLEKIQKTKNSKKKNNQFHKSLNKTIKQLYQKNKKTLPKNN